MTKLREALGLREPAPQQYLLTRRLFLALLGLVYLAAFASAFVQVEGLIGSRGILPADQLLDAVSQQLGTERYWRLPTLLWIGVNDDVLRGICIAGALLSLLPILGFASRAALLALFALYLSLVSVGSVFFGYQWDALLLESGLLALFFAPAGWKRQAFREAPVSRAGLWLLRWLLFRLMLLSGVVKLASGDPTWRDGSALTFHYFTQPIPTWTSYYAHRLPDFLLTASSFATLAIEVGAALLIFGPRRARGVAFVLLAGLQLLIAFTGNYGFFNLLTIALCVTLLDDGQLMAALPQALRERVERWTLPGPSAPESSRWAETRRGLVAFATGLLILLSIFVTLDRVGARLPRPGFVDALLEYSAAAHAINAYGLFGTMTTLRPEILLEGSLDGREWRAYEFDWKPVALDQRPVFAGLHMPRLDWQLWFAALRGCEGATWFPHLLARLLEGSFEVEALMRSNPFPDEPPRYLRSRRFLYEFEEPTAGNGNWWRRHSEDTFCAPVLRQGGQLRRADGR